MMKTIVEINGINYGSTGNITLNIARTAREEGFKVYTFFRNSRMGNKQKDDSHSFIGSWLDRVISERLSYILGLNGYFNIINTHLFIKELKRIKPDLIHIQSLCDNYLNIRLLFDYLADANTPVIWTLHDCWAFTGRCAQNRCTKWQEGCGNCPHKDYYPGTLLFDNSKMVLQKRNKIYNLLNNMTIVTPSKWLGDLVKISILKKFDVKVINNGIDLNVFKPTKSDFRKKYNLENKYILLGLAYYWDYGKGLDVFIELSKRLPDKYQIILVGTNDETDKVLPDNIISIHKTYDKKELVEIYSTCDLFVNPTRDDNYPTVNMEAIACGLPVLTFDTGGSAEIISETTGSSVPMNDIDGMEKEIIRICETKPYTKENCLKHAQNFDMWNKYKEYVELYKNLLSDD